MEAIVERKLRLPTEVLKFGIIAADAARIVTAPSGFRFNLNFSAGEPDQAAGNIGNRDGFTGADVVSFTGPALGH